MRWEPFSTLRFIWRHPLGRRQRLRATARYLRWQTWDRLRGGRLLDPWVGGARLVLRHGMAGATGNLYVGLHEFEEMAFLLHVLRPGDLFADVGANVGTYAVLAAAAAGARVVAFEPIAASADALRRNVAANRVEGFVDVRQAGVSDAVGTREFTSGSDAENRIARPEDRGRPDLLTVPVTTLDAAFSGGVPDLLKVDAEGHEVAVLRGGVRTLGARGLRAAIVEDWGREDGDGVAPILRDHGFGASRYDPWTRTLRDRGGDEGPPRANTLWVRRDPAVAERLRTAPPVRVFGLSI